MKGKIVYSLSFHTNVLTFVEVCRNKNISKSFGSPRAKEGEGGIGEREWRETLESHRLWHLGNPLREKQLSSLIPFNSPPSLIDLSFGPRVQPLQDSFRRKEAKFAT